jgi:hypothetical protein
LSKYSASRRQKAKAQSAVLGSRLRRATLKGKRQKGGICESLIRLFTILRFCADVNRPARTAIEHQIKIYKIVASRLI